MSDALVIVLDRCAAGRPRRRAWSSPGAVQPPGPAVDEEALRRLVEQDGRPAVAAGRTTEPQPEPDLGRFALLEPRGGCRRRGRGRGPPHGRRGRRRAAGALPPGRRAGPSRRRAPRPSGPSPPRAAQAAELRAGLEAERNRITVEATAALAEDRKELQAAEQRLRAATQALADEQQALVADRRRIGAEQGELTPTKQVAAGAGGGARRAAAELAEPAAALDDRERELDRRRGRATRPN